MRRRPAEGRGVRGKGLPLTPRPLPLAILTSKVLHHETTTSALVSSRAFLAVVAGIWQRSERAAASRTGAAAGQRRARRTRHSGRRSTSSAPTSSSGTGAGSFRRTSTKEDFEVYEDGVKQELTSFTLVHGGRVYQTLAATAAPVREGIILPPSRPVNDAAGRIILFVVDDLHLEFRDTHRVRKPVPRHGEGAHPRRRSVRHRLDRHVVDRDRPHLRPYAHGRGGQQDYRRRLEAVRNHSAVVDRRDAAGSHAPRERRVRDRVRDARTTSSRRSIAARRSC